jgi:ankyrin repeat protein
VRALLDAGTDAVKVGPQGWTALIWAAAAGRAAAVRALLDAGLDVDMTVTGGTTALMGAALYGHEAAVRALLKAGADVHKADEDGWTALMLAASDGHRAAGTAQHGGCKLKSHVGHSFRAHCSHPALPPDEDIRDHCVHFQGLRNDITLSRTPRTAQSRGHSLWSRAAGHKRFCTHYRSFQGLKYRQCLS